MSDLEKHIVNRFLSWKLPDDFQPDAGINFNPVFNEHTKHPMRHEPVGTNLLDFTQATEMVRHLLHGAPVAVHTDTLAQRDARIAELEAKVAMMEEAESLYVVKCIELIATARNEAFEEAGNAILSELAEWKGIRAKADGHHEFMRAYTVVCALKSEGEG